MKQTTRIAIAALLHSAGKVLSAFAFEFGGTEAVGEPEAQPETTPDPEKPKRGRKAAAAQPETPAETVAPAEPDLAAPTVTGKTYEELKAIIKPVVEAGNGEDVKKVIAKYATNLKALEGKPEHHEAFEKEIAALVY